MAGDGQVDVEMDEVEPSALTFIAPAPVFDDAQHSSQIIVSSPPHPPADCPAPLSIDEVSAPTVSSSVAQGENNPVPPSAAADTSGHEPTDNIRPSHAQLDVLTSEEILAIEQALMSGEEGLIHPIVERIDAMRINALAAAGPTADSQSPSTHTAELLKLDLALLTVARMLPPDDRQWAIISPILKRKDARSRKATASAENDNVGRPQPILLPGTFLTQEEDAAMEAGLRIPDLTKKWLVIEPLLDLIEQRREAAQADTSAAAAGPGLSEVQPGPSPMSPAVSATAEGSGQTVVDAVNPMPSATSPGTLSMEQIDTKSKKRKRDQLDSSDDGSSD